MTRNGDDALLRNLLTEMFQTEESAKEHASKEAARFDADAPPAAALRAVSAHAERSLGQLERLGDAGSGGLGKAIGRTFSAVRDKVGDRLVSREKSYRGTLLGLQHGVDCALLTKAVAAGCGREDVAEFLDDWLEARRPLVERCRHELRWFARHAEAAMQ